MGASLHEFQTETYGSGLSFWLMFGPKRCEASSDRDFGKTKGFGTPYSSGGTGGGVIHIGGECKGNQLYVIANAREVAVMITRNSRSLKAGIAAAVFLLAGLAMPGLCLASIGSLEISKTLTEDFDTHHFNSDYHYYALMDAGNPSAIVGLEKGYRIGGPYWKTVNPHSLRFSSLVTRVEESPVEGSSTYGAYILDAHNRKIGTWYSSMIASTAVNDRTKTVSVTINHNWLLN
jgi:hypothetical protein